MKLTIPERLRTSCRRTDQTEWLERLPAVVEEIAARWELTLDEPFDGREVSCAWVAPARRADGSPAVLKMGMPHMEGDHEGDALAFYNGAPTVRLLDFDRDANAMLLERCIPGTVLRMLPEEEQDVVVASMLRRLWRPPPALHPFRPLAVMTQAWMDETLADMERWPDHILVLEGLAMFEELPKSASDAVLLATDLHAGNILAAEREPWLVIDVKPFVGDPAYDVTQHLLNCEERMHADPLGTIERLANLAGVDAQRVRMWAFGRYASESRDVWDEDSMAIARTLAR